MTHVIKTLPVVIIILILFSDAFADETYRVDKINNNNNTSYITRENDKIKTILKYGMKIKNGDVISVGEGSIVNINNYHLKEITHHDSPHEIKNTIESKRYYFTKFLNLLREKIWPVRTTVDGSSKGDIKIIEPQSIVYTKRLLNYDFSSIDENIVFIVEYRKENEKSWKTFDKRDNRILHDGDRLRFHVKNETDKSKIFSLFYIDSLFTLNTLDSLDRRKIYPKDEVRNDNFIVKPDKITGVNYFLLVVEGEEFLLTKIYKWKISSKP